MMGQGWMLPFLDENEKEYLGGGQWNHLPHQAAILLAQWAWLGEQLKELSQGAEHTYSFPSFQNGIANNQDPAACILLVVRQQSGMKFKRTNRHSHETRIRMGEIKKQQEMWMVWAALKISMKCSVELPQESHQNIWCWYFGHGQFSSIWVMGI
jgi:hypothetical protein